MKKRIVITDLTRMESPRVCIGAYDIDGELCIRPVIPFEGITEEFLYQCGQLVVKPFAVVEFDFIRHIPQPPHSEDWEINPAYSPKFIREPSMEERRAFLERIKDASVHAIFGATIHYNKYLEEGEGCRSLGTVKAKRILSVQYAEKEGGKYKYRIEFIA